MTLPKNVADAVTRLDTACVDGRVMPSDDAWQTIRAHLMSQENDAESRVAAANALLSDVLHQWPTLNDSLRTAIQSHLQGSGYE